MAETIRLFGRDWDVNEAGLCRIPGLPGYVDVGQRDDLWTVSWVVQATVWQGFGATREEAAANLDRELEPMVELFAAARDAQPENPDPEPVHAWFELTYSSYFVMQRSVLQSMPVNWQRQFVALVQQIPTALQVDDVPSEFMVKARKDGRFVSDPYREYRHLTVPRREVSDA